VVTRRSAASWPSVALCRPLSAGGLHDGPSEPQRCPHMSLRVGHCVGRQQLAPTKWRVDARPSRRMSTCCDRPRPRTGGGILPRTRIHRTSVVSPCQRQAPAFPWPPSRVGSFLFLLAVELLMKFGVCCSTAVPTPFSCLSSVSAIISSNSAWPDLMALMSALILP
jgi:hypothetical protein